MIFTWNAKDSSGADKVMQWDSETNVISPFISAEPPVIPPENVWDKVNEVSFNGVRVPIDGVNRERLQDEIILYTDAIEYLKTNKWGTDVRIDRATMKVSSIRDREHSLSGVWLVMVPDVHLIISGHHDGGQVLNEAAHEGDTVVLSIVDRPAPEKPPVVSGALPKWITAAYWQQYEGPTVDSLPSAYNMIWAAFAIGNGEQRMTFQPYHQDDKSFIAQMRKLQENGVRWGISMGGGVPYNAQTFIRSKSEALEVAKGLAPIIKKYGFTGLDDDLENGPGGFTEEGLTELFRIMRSEYGPNFVLASTPRPYETFRVKIAANLFRNPNVKLDLLQWQFYDSMEYRQAAYLRDRVKKELENAVELGIPLSAQLIGAITYRFYKYGWNRVEVYRDIAAEWKKKGLRGAFIWELSMDKKEGNSFANLIGAMNEKG